MTRKLENFLNNRKMELMLASIFAFVCLICLFGMISSPSEKVLLKDYYQKLDIVGEYSVDNGETFHPFSKVSELDTEHAQNIIVKGHFSSDIKRGENVYMYLDNIEAYVEQNGRVIYVSNEDIVYGWDAFKSLGIGTNDEITITLDTRYFLPHNKSFALFFDSVCNATKASVLSRMLQRNWIAITASLAILMLGVCMFVYFMELKILKTEGADGLLSCALALVCGSVTTLIQHDFITLILPDFSLLEYVDMLSQVFSIYFVLVYMKRYISDSRRLFACKLLIVISATIISAYSLATLLGFETTSFIQFVVFVDGLGVLVLYVVILIRDNIANGRERAISVVNVSLVVILLCAIVEMLYYVITGIYIMHFLRFGLLFFGIVQFAVIVRANMESRREAAKAQELENELLQSQINIMMSQIQPHFLFNALGTIRALCTKDPEEAKKAMDFFAKYLRANMDSLDRKECIPFKKELEHVESYLYIEKLRFGKLLNVKYEIEATDFEIPGMTIQTLTENAVKHGLLAKAEGGTVTIRTRETLSYYEIQIEDDGVGFDTTQRLDDSRTHVGIENSRQRVARMCGGSLYVGSKIGEGTVITITIPKTRE